MSLFLHLAELCDALAATTKKLEKRAFIADYLRTLPVPDAARAALWLSGTPFPETEARVLNIGGSLLSKAVAELSGASQADLSAAYRRHGDFGSAAADLLYGQRPHTATITLVDVESALASIAEARGPAPKLRLLLDLLRPRHSRRGEVPHQTRHRRHAHRRQAVARRRSHRRSVPGPSRSGGTVRPQARGSRVRPTRQHAPRLPPEVVALAAAGRLDHARMKLFHPIGFMLASPVQSTEEAIARFTEEIKSEQAAAPATSVSGHDSMVPQICPVLADLGMHSPRRSALCQGMTSVVP